MVQQSHVWGVPDQAAQYCAQLQRVKALTMGFDQARSEKHTAVHVFIEWRTADQRNTHKATCFCSTLAVDVRTLSRAHYHQQQK